MDQTDPWKVVPRQVFTSYDCLLISVAFVFLCGVGFLWVTGVNYRDFKIICSLTRASNQRGTLWLVVLGYGAEDKRFKSSCSQQAAEKLFF